MDFAYNKNIMNKLNHMEDSLESVRDMKFPETIPVVVKCCSSFRGDNCELLETWETLHREVISETDKSKVVRLNGGYYLHYDKEAGGC